MLNVEELCEEGIREELVYLSFTTERNTALFNCQALLYLGKHSNTGEEVWKMAKRCENHLQDPGSEMRTWGTRLSISFEGFDQPSYQVTAGNHDSH